MIFYIVEKFDLSSLILVVTSEDVDSGRSLVIILNLQRSRLDNSCITSIVNVDRANDVKEAVLDSSVRLLASRVLSLVRILEIPKIKT